MKSPVITGDFAFKHHSSCGGIASWRTLVANKLVVERAVRRVDHRGISVVLEQQMSFEERADRDPLAAHLLQRERGVFFLPVPQRLLGPAHERGRLGQRENVARLRSRSSW